MNGELRILNLEDSPNDSELIRSELEAYGITCEFVRVDSMPDFIVELENGNRFDLILADFSLPAFDGISALILAKEKTDLPFIFVSGEIGEDLAIEALRNGATDYVFKNKLDKLGPAVKRAVLETKERNERREIERSMQTSNALLKLFSQTFSRKKYLEAVVDLIMDWSGCRYVGIRILDREQNIPYEAYAGFSREFWESECMLSLEKDECTCTRVISGRPDPQDFSLLTTFGSFRSGDTFSFIDSLSPDEKKRFRRVCLRHGFASLAVIPIKYRENTLGAIQLADKEKGKVLPRVIDLLETMIPLIGEAIHRFSIEDDLVDKYEQLRDLSAHLQSVREDERTRIAREIHDELGQSLTALKMDLSWIGRNSSDQRISEKARSMSGVVDSTIVSVKRIISQLRPGVLDHLGLVPALEWQSREFQERMGIECEFVSGMEDISLDDDLSTAVFRIFQEALTNIARHSGADRVETSLELKGDLLTLTLRDNGKGISSEKKGSDKSFGLIGMRERARYLGGEITISGEPGKGTCLVLNLPLKNTPGALAGKSRSDKIK